MVWKTKTAGGELLGSADTPNRYRALRFWIAGNLVAGMAGVYLEQADDVQAQVRTTEVSQPPETQIQTLQTEILPQTEPPPLSPEAAAHKERIIENLGSYGLKPVKAPDEVNLPEQFIVTADDECAVQFGVTADSLEAVNISTYLIGPEKALKNLRILALDGTSRGQTIHAEGQFAIGVELPAAPEAVGQVIEHLRETTDFYCDLLANHQ